MGATRRWGRWFRQKMGKVSIIRRELERCRRGCKHVHIKDTNRALILNSEHIGRENKKNEHMPKIPIREDRNASKQVRSQERTYAYSKLKLRFAIFRGGWAKTDPRCGAACWEVCSCSGSRMGRRMDLKMSMSDSSATIWRWMERHAMTEPPRTTKCEKVSIRKWMGNRTSTTKKHVFYSNIHFTTCLLLL